MRNISTSHHDEAIVRSIVQLARSFGLQTIAEGVETEQASHIVDRAGCDIAQGYLFAAPMSSDAFLNFLLQQQACSSRPTELSQNRLYVL